MNSTVALPSPSPSPSSRLAVALVAWGDPPPQGATRFWGALEELAAHPGTWGVLAQEADEQGAQGVARDLRRARVRKPAEGEWEFVARQHRVYGRWLGLA